MGEFTSESLSIALTIIMFGIMVTTAFFLVPWYTDIMIQVVEASVI